MTPQEKIDYLNRVANIGPSRLEGDEDAQCYYSKHDGSYITRVGMEADFKEFPIRLNLTELQAPHGRVASLGFCADEQKWYGWSHRAYYGFGIGSTVKRGDCAYVPVDKEDARLEAIRFWTDEFHTDMAAEETARDGVTVTWTYTDTVPNKSLRGTQGSQFVYYPDDFGKGEWTAETMVQAKQMAADFAESVS